MGAPQPFSDNPITPNTKMKIDPNISSAPVTSAYKLYTEHRHLNSRNAVRRGLTRVVDALGWLTFKDVYSMQVVRCSEADGGYALDRAYTPAIVRACRSKYEPHVGAKQLARRR